MNFKIYETTKDNIPDVYFYTISINDRLLLTNSERYTHDRMLIKFHHLNEISNSIRKQTYPNFDLVSNFVGINSETDLDHYFMNTPYQLTFIPYKDFNYYQSWKFIKCIFETDNTEELCNLFDHIPEYYY